MPRLYVIDGAQVTSLESFWKALGEAVNGPGGYFGESLDGLEDCLHGGFGTPDDEDFGFEWRAHEVSKRYLGYPETIRQLERRLAGSHPTNRAEIAADLATARTGAGPTVFDWLTDILGAEPGRLRLT